MTILSFILEASQSSDSRNRHHHHHKNHHKSHEDKESQPLKKRMPANFSREGLDFLEVSTLLTTQNYQINLIKPNFSNLT